MKDDKGTFRSAGWFERTDEQIHPSQLDAAITGRLRQPGHDRHLQHWSG
jgi:hypothetical protein